MDTVNISIPDTEKVINYAPNYFRRLNVTLAAYNKRSVCMSDFVCEQYPVCISLWGWKHTACNELLALSQFTIVLCEPEGFIEHPSSPHRDLQNYMVWRFAMNMVVGLSRAYRDTKKALRKVH